VSMGSPMFFGGNAHPVRNGDCPSEFRMNSERDEAATRFFLPVVSLLMLWSNLRFIQYLTPNSIHRFVAPYASVFQNSQLLHFDQMFVL
jgi:hypothetical protein